MTHIDTPLAYVGESGRKASREIDVIKGLTSLANRLRPPVRTSDLAIVTAVAYFFL